MADKAIRPFSHKHAGEPDSLGSYISQIIGQMGRKDPKALRAAQANMIWESVAPRQVVEHTDNVYLLNTDGCKEMVVMVDDSAWTADLMAQQEHYRFEVEQRLGEGRLDRIRFKTSTSTARRNERRKKVLEASAASDLPVIEPIPVTDEEKRIIVCECACIEDESLREALVAARIASLEREKGEAAHEVRKAENDKAAEDDPFKDIF